MNVNEVTQSISLALKGDSPFVAVLATNDHMIILGRGGQRWQLVVVEIPGDRKGLVSDSDSIIAGKRKRVGIAYLRYIHRPNSNYETEWRRYLAALNTINTSYDAFVYDYIAGAY